MTDSYRFIFVNHHAQQTVHDKILGVINPGAEIEFLPPPALYNLTVRWPPNYPNQNGSTGTVTAPAVTALVINGEKVRRRTVDPTPSAPPARSR